MRDRTAIAALLLVTLSGCNHVQLARSMGMQNATVATLQRQMVMDNITIFAEDKYAIPWHTRITGGLVQVADQANGAFAAELTDAPAVLTPSVGAQRGIVGQWNVSPVVEAEDLELLRLAYQRAVFPDDGEVYRNICKKIAETSVKYNLPLSKQVFDKLARALIGQEETLADDYGTPHRSNQARRRKLDEALARSRDVHRDLNAAKKGREMVGIDVGEVADIYEDEWDPLMNDLSALHDKLAAEKSKRSDEPYQTTHKNLAKKMDRIDRVFAARIRPLAATLKPLDASIASAEQRAVDLAEELLAPLPFRPKYPSTARAERNIAVIDQAQDKIKALCDLADLDGDNSDGINFSEPWVWYGPKRRMPRGACCVGHRGGCYAWINPEDARKLNKFVLIVLDLAPPDKQDIVTGFGPAFTPSLR